MNGTCGRCGQPGATIPSQLSGSDKGWHVECLALVVANLQAYGTGWAR